MKVGTDGVLLGAWTDVDGIASVLDIGTGSGLIALMLAQRSSAAIDAIEIEEKAFSQARENIAESIFKERISVFHTSLQEFHPQRCYDLIVSNPPYFSQSLKNPQEEKTLARHSDTLSQEDLLSFAAQHLSKDGRLSVIFPVEEGLSFIKKAKELSLPCRRLTRVIPREGAEAKRLLIELSRNGDVSCETSDIQIETGIRHHYSDEYRQLTQDFYLAL
jgi:tRNA1Val (adenine37-N6)-methyltransferase